jgi:hypothetical protein
MTQTTSEEFKLYLTEKEWQRYLAEFDFHSIRNPKIRLGFWFVNDYPAIAQDLREHSHLGGNPGHCPSMDELLERMESNLEAKLFIQEFVEIRPDGLEH